MANGLPATSTLDNCLLHILVMTYLHKAAVACLHAILFLQPTVVAALLAERLPSRLLQAQPAG
jgi:hypothetical protein